MLSLDVVYLEEKKIEKLYVMLSCDRKFHYESNDVYLSLRFWQHSQFYTRLRKIASDAKLPHISMFSSAPSKNCKKFKFHREKNFYLGKSRRRMSLPSGEKKNPKIEDVTYKKPQTWHQVIPPDSIAEKLRSWIRRNMYLLYIYWTSGTHISFLCSLLTLNYGMLCFITASFFKWFFLIHELWVSVRRTGITARILYLRFYSNRQPRLGPLELVN